MTRHTLGVMPAKAGIQYLPCFDGIERSITTGSSAFADDDSREYGTR
jgi:hypothetical protein